jgi:signal transduction histidine kinase
MTGAVVHANDRTRVTRLTLDGRRIIRKEPLGTDAPRRLRHEVGMLERLRGVEGIAQLVDAPQYADSIVMEDAGPTSLAELGKPLAVDDVIALAVQLARALADMHGRGVMHRDVAPANIVLSPGGAACLVDFALATAFAEVRPEFTHHSEIVGTLPYLAPEQTGRTGRPVDQRADLYALGATLYELATGAPPFGSGDPLRLTHDHLARVPVAPAEANRAIPGPLSEIVMRLLEKEPDRRYQSAQGVLYDLERLRDGQPGPIGAHDVPPRLLAPSRLAGRDDEAAALEAAFEASRQGRCPVVLVTGAPGVGKTALVNELRPAVTARDGWFVTGKFDQYRRDLEFDGVYQVFRALGRLLLAEPENELIELRERILKALGPNAGLTTAVVPEFAALLAVPPDPGDPLTAQVRAQRNAMELLRATATPERPLVVFVDDLQWAGRTPLGLFDLALSEEPIEGLLLVGAYREADVDVAHPLAALLSRAGDRAAVQRLGLANLPVPDVVTIVAETLHVDRDAAMGLVGAIQRHTSGNPYETVELLNALRHDGLLTATAAGWRWDDAEIRVHLDRTKAAGLPTARIDALPAAAREMVEAMACLGGRTELSVLQTASGEPAGVVEERLAPALEDGLLVVEPGRHQAVRFRHDRIHEAVVTRLPPLRRRSVQLAMARRLAAAPELFAVAAEQYLPVVDALDDPTERQQAADLLCSAADQGALIGDNRLVDALLAAASRLIDPSETVKLIQMHTARHAALYGLARLDEADDEYLIIERLAATALQRADATTVQIHSLTHRHRIAETLQLGSGSLRELGIDLPADRSALDVDAQFDHLYRWLDRTDDLERAEMSDPTLLAATRLINALIPAAYLGTELGTVAWLGLEGVRIWLEHGPSRTLVGPASHAAFAAVAMRGDYGAGHRAYRRILALGEARGYEPETSQARFVFSLQSCWFEPIESCVEAARRARKGLLAGGDVANTGYTFHPTVEGLLDCASSLNEFVAEVESGLAFVRRAGSEGTGLWLDSYRWLADVLRSDGSAAAGEPVPIDNYADNPAALLHALATRAIAAAIFDDPDGVSRHTASAAPLLRAFQSLYPTAWLQLLRGLALAGGARAAERDDRAGLLTELDEVTRWLADRAADAPENFLHLVRLLEAERAWATGDFQAAMLAFDAARREVAQRQRPWHRALIAERAARFRLANDMERDGYDLLAQARLKYLAWGATAKVNQLDWAYPTLRLDHEAPGDPKAAPPDRHTTLTTGTIDLLGILSASRALSSETSVERLHARVVEVLSNMTGATGVDLVLWSDDRQSWRVPGNADDSRDERALPMSVLRYVQRTGEPLIVGDATADDRFARDPYFASVGVCSLLAVPIVTRGTLGAVLLLENRLLRGAFTAERLESVKLIAGQLAVSLDNAQVNAQYRRIADEQSALRRVAVLAASSVAPLELFATVAEEVGTVLGADVALLGRYGADYVEGVGAWSPAGPASFVGRRMPLGGDDVSTHVLKSGAPARIDRALDVTGQARSIWRQSGVSAAVGAPITVAGRLWGVMLVGSTDEARLPPGIEHRLAAFTELVATAIANAQSRAELEASRARLVTEADAARRRVVRDLHDGAQQRLVHTVITLELAQRAHRRDDDDLEPLMADALEHARRANEELRKLAHGILPSDLVRGGLRGGVDAVVKRLDLAVNVDLPPERFPAEIEASAYFIVAEALTNIVKHAHAESADVTASVHDGILQLEVRDNGVGGADPGGRGLVGLNDRVTALGGRLGIRSPAGSGTVLTATLPISHDPADAA